MPRFPRTAPSAQSLSDRVFGRLVAKSGAHQGRLYPLHVGDTYLDPLPQARAQEQLAEHRERLHNYSPVQGEPALLDAICRKIARRSRVVVEPDCVQVMSGATAGLGVVCTALLEPGDEVIVPDPEWPPCAGNIKLAHGVPVPCPLHEHLGWRYDLGELEARITPKTRAIYLNSPHNPTGGVLTREDVESIAAIAARRGIWIISDEAYEDVLFDGAEHVSPASLPGMYERTISLYTFSKTYAMTGLRLGYVAAQDAALRDRMKKALFYTASNVASVVQFGGIGGLEGRQDTVAQYRQELQARRDLFYDGIRANAGSVFSGEPPRGAFYAFLRIDPSWVSPAGAKDSISWAMTEYLISRGRIGCVPGADFGANGEGYVRFCFARDRRELAGALASMQSIFNSDPIRNRPAARAAAQDS